jgi:hypothetical protein
MLDTVNVPNMTDDEIRAELSYCEPGSRDYAILSDELQRRSLARAGRAATDLTKSSRKVERLTWTLIVLTVILILLAVPPAWEAVTGWLSN